MGVCVCAWVLVLGGVWFGGIADVGRAERGGNGNGNGRRGGAANAYGGHGGATVQKPFLYRSRA
ncbi:MAG: hypothetical protein IPK82_23365 [Polyangiaceae bacterium]|nr:hypothetical protein [Polyangiaceae bacterium]